MADVLGGEPAASPQNYSPERLAHDMLRTYQPGHESHRLAKAYLDAMEQLRRAQSEPAQDDQATRFIAEEFEKALGCGVFPPTYLADSFAARALREEGFAAGYRAAVAGLDQQGWLACYQGSFPYHVIERGDLPVDKHAWALPVYSLPEGLTETD